MDFSLVHEFLLVSLIPLIVLAAAALLPAQHLIHIFQLESYKRTQFFMHVKEDTQARRALMTLWLPFLLLQAVVFLACNRLRLGGIVQGAATAAVFLAGMIVYYIRWKKQPSKKPLKVTARVVRLDAALFAVLAVFQLIVAFVLSALLSLAATGLLDGGRNTVALVALTMVALMLPLISIVVAQLFFVPGLARFIAVASVAVQPVENAVKNWYFNDARKKLSGLAGLIRVGITGSYGKTSAKVILSTILSEKYKTYATPHSYNTPMGVTRAIREQLDASYQVFIAEMGARNPGDIAEMCRLASPQYGLITSVGAQHLETFKTVENVAKTKYELIEALPQDGMAFFPSDNEICLNLYKKTAKPKALFGLDGHGEKLSMSARDVSSGPRGSTFTLMGADGGTVPCTTKLLGGHNVQNILGAAAVARALGLSMEEISRGIGKLEPVEHRLQLVPTGNGVTVIDDAFNSNPAGTRAAMEVIKSFPGRKIVVTPGLVELGDAEFAENEAFGRAMAGAADLAILVARNAEAMKRGLLEAGFSESKIIVTGKLVEATAALGRLTQVGDVVLFENDLPDHYET